jgi:hypothetical protein
MTEPRAYCTFYLPVDLADAVRAAAAARGVSDSTLIDDLVVPLGRERLFSLAREPRLSAGPKIELRLNLPEVFLEMLQAAAVAADCSLSHVLQRACLLIRD